MQFKEETNLRSPVKKPTKLPIKNLGFDHLGRENAEEPSTSAISKEKVKMEESEDYTFEEPPLKKLKSSTRPQGNCVKFVDEDQKMNWDIVQVQDLFPFVIMIVDSLCLNLEIKFVE